MVLTFSLFRWFVGLSLDNPAWHPTTFIKNWDRLLAHGLNERFLAEVNRQAHSGKLLSRDHFSLGGTLLDACASIKFFCPKEPSASPPEDDEGAGGGGDFRGMCLTNTTYQSTMDPDARQGLRVGMQGLKRHAPRPREAFWQGGGQAHHPACGLSGEHGQAQACRGTVRLG